MTETTTYIRKGDIFYVELGTERNGSVQNGGATGVRPCVIMANKVACEVSPVLLVVPITSSFGKHRKGMPTHLELGNTLPKKSVALSAPYIHITNAIKILNKILSKYNFFHTKNRLNTMFRRFLYFRNCW